jgi:hypothetical protein
MPTLTLARVVASGEVRRMDLFREVEERRMLDQVGLVHRACGTAGKDVVAGGAQQYCGEGPSNM